MAKRVISAFKKRYGEDAPPNSELHVTAEESARLEFDEGKSPERWFEDSLEYMSYGLGMVDLD